MIPAAPPTLIPETKPPASFRLPPGHADLTPITAWRWLRATHAATEQHAGWVTARQVGSLMGFNGHVAGHYLGLLAQARLIETQQASQGRRYRVAPTFAQENRLL